MIEPARPPRSPMPRLCLLYSMTQELYQPSWIDVVRLVSDFRDLANRGRVEGMCRNIRVLSNFEPPATPDEIEAAAIQYVRKVSGATKPSAANQEAFDEAVRVVTEATRELLDKLVIKAPPRDREVEAAKAKARAAERYGVRA